MSSLGSHVGDLAAALVDDQLEPPARDVVLLHVAGCPQCRAEVEEQRRLKLRLSELTAPGLPDDLAGRLASLASAGKPPLPGVGGDRPPLTAMPAVGGVLAARPASHLSLFRDPRRSRRLLVGAASLLLVGAGTAFAAASDAQPGSPVRPAAPVLTNTQPVSVRTAVPLHDPAFTAMTVSYGR